MDNKFNFYPTKFSNPPTKSQEVISASTYLTEYFIRHYIEKRFSISSNYAQNYKNWCDCSSNAINTIPSAKNISKLGIVNSNEDCYLCKFSDTNIYRNFVKDEKGAFENFAKDGISKQVHILNISSLFEKVQKTELGMMDILLNKTYPVYVLNGYKIDFIIETISKNKIIERDVLIGYIQTSGLQNLPHTRKVTSASYSFNPNYKIVLSNYMQNKFTGGVYE